VSQLYSVDRVTGLTTRSVHADSSPDPFDDPKVETIVEIFRRIHVRPALSLW